MLLLILVTSLSLPVVKDKAILNWTHPITRADNSILPYTEIAGYKIYKGASKTNLKLVHTINDRKITTYTDNNLGVGHHYYAVTVYNIYGAESAYSTIVSKEVVSKWPEKGSIHYY